MTYFKPITAKSLFKDDDNKLAIWQMPNVLLSSWIATKLLGFIVTGRFKSGLDLLGMAVLFAWAYSELNTGVNYFRKVLGLVVLVPIVIGFFR
jgi:hypothetical protein